MAVLSLLPPAATLALGWTLVHFLWQGVGIAAAAALLMAQCRTPSARYWLGVGALVLMVAAPITTFLLFDPLRLALPFSPLRLALPALLPRALLPLLVQAWLAGVALLSLRFAGGFLLLERVRRRQSTEPPARVLALCHQVQHRLRITRSIRYLECGWLQVPAAIGAIRPLILLPVAALMGLSEAQLRAVIAHELAHVRRWDFLVNLFQVMSETLLFYHPALWWLNRRIRAERELCCDEIAMAFSGDPVDYAQALVLMAKQESVSGLAMAATHGILSERVFHILGHGRVRSRATGLVAGAFFLTASLAAGCALLMGAPAPKAAVRQDAILATITALPARILPMRLAVIAAPAPGPSEAAPHTTMAVLHRRIKPRLVSPNVQLAQLMADPGITAPVPVLMTPDDPPLIQMAQADDPPAPHPMSVVAQKLDALAALDDFYPAPVLKLSASRAIGEWTRAEEVTYCRNYTAQTVTQGANRPMLVDDGFKHRLFFFYWHCMLSNNNGTIRSYGSGSGPGPGYDAVGTAASERSVAVAGNWVISFSPRPGLAAMMAEHAGARSCSFTQSGNTFGGTCTGRDGSGSVSGIIDGRQVRWIWKSQHDDGRHEREFDFIGMVNADGILAGQSMMPDTDSYRIEAFTATPGGADLAQK